MKRIAVLALAATLVLGACGDDKKKDDAGSATTTSAAAGTETTQTTAAGGAPGGTPTTAGGTGATTAPGQAPQPAQPPPPTTQPPFPVQARLEKACVRRGSTTDKQVLVVKTRPGSGIAYSTQYSDGSNEMTKPSYQKAGGHGTGKADAEGNFRAEWTVPVDAPTGTAKVTVATDQRIHGPYEFRVAGELESC